MNQAPESGNAITFSGVHHINFTVTDLERSARWYANVLGLTKGWAMPDAEGRGQKAVLLHPSSPFRLVLTRHQANEGEPFSEYRTGLDHIAFTVQDREELDQWVRRLDELGV